MVCKFCGATISNNASFCASCGRRKEDSAPSVETAYTGYVSHEVNAHQLMMQKEAVRTSEIASLKGAISYFSSMSAVFGQYGYACEKLIHYGRGAKGALIVWGAIITFFGIVFTATLGAHPAILWSLLVPGVLMITGGILMKVNNRSKFNRYLREYAATSAELYRAYTLFPNCPVGPEYTNPDVLKYLLRVIESGRADSIKESINIGIDFRPRGKAQRFITAVQQNTASLDPNTRVSVIFLSGSLVN